MRPSHLIAVISWGIFWTFIALNSWGAGLLPGFGAGLTHEGKMSPLMTAGYSAALLYVVCMPLLNLLWPNRTTMVLAAVAQIPLVVAAWRLWWVWPIALGIISPVLLWINAAHTQWQTSKRSPWSAHPGHAQGKPSHQPDSTS